MGRSTFATAMVAIAVFLHSVAVGQQFSTSRPDFLANVAAAHYEEAFTSWSEGDPLDGHQKIWEAPGENDFSWEVTASGSGNQSLYSLYHAVSTSSHEDTLVFTFTGKSVYAFGGNFWGTMFDGFPQTAEITFKTDTGRTFSHSVTGRTFLGIVSNVPLSTVTITAASKQAAWVTAGDVITGDLNPDGDLDGDGMTNDAELLAGTDPGNPNSNLRISSASVQNANLIITFSAVAGKTYCLEFANGLKPPDWQASSIPCQAAQASGPAEFIVSSWQMGSFYRVRMQVPK